MTAASFKSIKTIALLAALGSFIAYQPLSIAAPAAKAQSAPTRKIINTKKKAQPVNLKKQTPVKKPVAAQKPVKKPAGTKPQNADAVMKKAQVLFQRFVDTKTNISWKCFSQKLATTLEGSPRYRPFVDELKKLNTEKSPLKIGARITAYKHLLTPETNTLLKQYTAKDMLAILEKRIALNDKGQC
jgi:hypothetical protein